MIIPKFYLCFSHTSLSLKCASFLSRTHFSQPSLFLPSSISHAHLHSLMCASLLSLTSLLFVVSSHFSTSLALSSLSLSLSLSLYVCVLFYLSMCASLYIYLSLFPLHLSPTVTPLSLLLPPLLSACAYLPFFVSTHLCLPQTITATSHLLSLSLHVLLFLLSPSWCSPYLSLSSMRFSLLCASLSFSNTLLSLSRYFWCFIFIPCKKWWHHG